MKLKQLKKWKGVVAMLMGTCSPFGGWATGDVSLRGAIVLAGIGFLTSLHNWLDTELSQIMERRRLRLEEEAMSKDDCPEPDLKPSSKGKSKKEIKS